MLLITQAAAGRKTGKEVVEWQALGSWRACREQPAFVSLLMDPWSMGEISERAGLVSGARVEVIPFPSTLPVRPQGPS